jgi:hypothetical protein
VTGVFKAVLVMTGTPPSPAPSASDARALGHGLCGLMGTVSGVIGGLAATDPKLVPRGA